MPMSAELEKNLAGLKERIEKAKSLKYKAEARLEELQRQRTQLLDELKELGVTAETLPQEIERLEAEIRRMLADAEQLLPPAVGG
jgi:F0F1-type ATP synthase membrane subunit b/b'